VDVNRILSELHIKKKKNKPEWILYKLSWTSLGVQWMRVHLPMQQTWVRSLGPEDPLEKEMATHSGILAWRILWTEEPGGLQVHKSRT